MTPRWLAARIRDLVEDAGLGDLLDVRVTWPADVPGNPARHRWRIEVHPKVAADEPVT
jgi:hypothetical protein